MSETKTTEPRDLKAILSDLESKQERAGEILSEINDGTGDQKALKGELEELGTHVEELKAEQSERQSIEERNAMKAQITTLESAIEELRKPDENGFTFSGTGEEERTADSPYRGKAHSFFEDVRNAQRGHTKSFERIVEAAENAGLDTKAMTEGTDSAGGYLVPPEVSDELVRLKTVATPLRELFSRVQVQSDTLQIAQQTGGLTAAWTDELATKTAADFTFGQISVSVFTAAGLAVVSNQLLADARPSIDGLITSDLARRIAILEEKAFINGTGTGQPRGILQTSGINGVTYTDASPTVTELLPKILEAITAVQSNGLTEPTHIVMHPAIWNKIIATPSVNGYYVIGTSGARQRTASDPLPPRSLFGYPVVLSFNVPQNLGAGTNETAVIVGDFPQGLILDRQGLTVDDSSHVYFTSNQTVFRAESRVGFTAARDPKAFAAVTGTGLIGASLSST